MCVCVCDGSVVCVCVCVCVWFRRFTARKTDTPSTTSTVMIALQDGTGSTEFTGTGSTLVLTSVSVVALEADGVGDLT